MPVMHMYGTSDDLVEVIGITGADEFNVNEQDRYAGSFNLGGKLRIHAIYDGCWSFAVGQVDENIPIPDWRVRVRQSPQVSYSTCLEIEVPDDVKIFREPDMR